MSGNRGNKVICLVPPGPRDRIARFPDHWEACFVHRNDDLTAGLTEGARALLTTHPYLVGRAELELLNGVELVQQVGVGVDNIDVDAARELGVPVCNVPQANAVSVAEYVIMACVFLLRRMADATAALRRFENPYPALFARGSHEVRGKKLGLVGYGAIAHEVAKRALALEMELLSASAPRRERERGLAPGADERELGVVRLPFEQLLRESDVVSVHVPLSDATRDLIGASELALMKPSAFLINTSRGGIVNEGRPRRRAGPGPDRGGRGRRLQRRADSGGQPAARRAERLSFSPQRRQHERVRDRRDPGEHRQHQPRPARRGAASSCLLTARQVI